MGFLDALVNLASATVKVALTPVAVAVDAVNIVSGDDVEATTNLLGSAVEDLEKAGDEIV